MGWWNQSIYGGDEPLKWQEIIYGICEINVYGDDHSVQPIPVDTLSEKIDDIVSEIEKNSTDNNNKNIGYQVLGAIIMHAGFDFDSILNNLKDRIIESAEEDSYSKENFVRKNVMKNFKKLIKEYNFLEPVNVIEVNVFEEAEDDDEQIAKEFKEIFSLMKARIKKLESGKEEKSGSDEYDKGYEDASQEEIDFLTDFMELMSKMEMMGNLLEKISQGLVGNPVSTSPMEKEASMSRGENVAIPVSENKSQLKSAPGTGKDIMPG